jgi:membrane associated rhomboid family serine protease/Zn-finger nucleic acid-binding protein
VRFATAPKPIGALGEGASRVNLDYPAAVRAQKTQHCPRCQIPLSRVQHLEAESALCGRCRGLFLTARDQSSTMGKELGLLTTAPQVQVPFEARIECPSACALMESRLLQHETHAVTFDRCRVCKGLWLDGGEIQLIRQITSVKRTTVRLERAATKERDAINLAKRQLQLDKAEVVGGDDEVMAKTSGAWWLFSFITQLPLEGHNPVYRVPIWTWAFIISCTLLFISPAVVGMELVERFVFRPTDLEAFPSGFMKMISTSFLHGSWLHLLGNMYFLKVFGDNVEDRLGRLWFPLFYVGADLVGSIIYVLTTTDPSTPVVGASGAISGLLGGYLVFFPDARISVAPQLLTLFRQIHVRALFYLPFWLVLQFLYSAVSGGGVAWWAHIGGFAGGFALAGLALRLIPDARVTALATEFASGQRRDPVARPPSA